jgi:hypothetical protein
MNAPAEAFRCQALAKEIAAELRAKYDLKAAIALPVNVCLLRSSIMIRAAPLAVARSSREPRNETPRARLRDGLKRSVMRGTIFKQVVLATRCMGI